MKKLVLVFVMMMLFSFAAPADIPRPQTPTPTPTPEPSPTAKVKTQKSIDARLQILLVKTDTAKLKIPKSQIAQLRAQLDELDGGGNSAAAAAGTGLSVSRIQTIVSGAFLSLAIVFGGLWFVRSKTSKPPKNGVSKTGQTGKTAAILAVLFLSGAAATAVVANVGPPPEARSISGKLFTDYVHQYMQASGNIKLVVNDDKNEESIVLEVPDPHGYPDRDEE
jgi:hypothetical protein